MQNGLLTNEELIISLLQDLNNLPRLLFQGQNIAFCDQIAKMGQKLANLQKGVKNDMDNRNNTIEQLKNQIKELGGEYKEIPVEELLQKDGAE